MKNEELKAISNRIKKRRKQIGLTQEQFAEMIELSASSYTKIENAFQKPALDTLVKIAEKLNVSLDFLVFGNEHDIPTEQDLADIVFEFADVDSIIHVREVLNKIIRIKKNKNRQELERKVSENAKDYFKENEKNST